MIEKKLGSLAGKRVGRKTGAGIVDAYIHSDKRIGVLVELFSETDFVARNPEFVMLAHGLALHIAALGPQYLSRDSVPDEIVNAERARFEEEVQRLGKPEKIMREIIDGKLASHFGAVSLLEQPYIKDQDKTVREVINEAIGKFGENIQVGRFVRFEL